MRDIERERATLQRQEKTLTIEIKNMARKGQMVTPALTYLSNKANFLNFSLPPELWQKTLFAPASTLRSSIHSSRTFKVSAYVCR